MAGIPSNEYGERELRAERGGELLGTVYRLVDALAGNENLRMRDYLRTAGVRDL